MKPLPFTVRAAVLAAVALLGTRAAANTYIVDSTGAGRFTDIQSAILAVQPGDVLIVQHQPVGGYAGFTLDRGLVIIANSLGLLAGPVQVSGIPAGQRAALIGFSLTSLGIANCNGPVFVDPNYNITISVAVTNSKDVRLTRSHPYGDSNHSGVTVVNSRVEIVDSDVRGGQGAPDASAIGEPGLDASAGARVQAARSNIFGGAGSTASISSISCGNGGPALLLASPATVILAGPHVVDPIIGDTGYIYGGGGGWGLFEGGGECWADGLGSCAIIGSGLVDESGVSIRGGYTDQTFHCIGGFYEPAFCGPTDQPIVPVDPTLQLVGTPNPGATITFTIFGEPGASAVLDLGRGMIVIPTSGVEIERLTQAARVIPMGIIGASGSVSHAMHLAANFAPGLLFVAQAEVTGSSGLQRTNSTPIVVR